MKRFKILSENYVKGTHLIIDAQEEISNIIQEKVDYLDELLNRTFLNEEISVESPEYFTFKSDPLVKSLLCTDYDKELGDIIFINKTNKLPLTNAAKCALSYSGIQAPVDNIKQHFTSIDIFENINNLFGVSSELTNDWLVETTQQDKNTFGSIIHNTSKKAKTLVEETNDSLKTICKYDKEPLRENLLQLIYIKEFINEYRR